MTALDRHIEGDSNASSYKDGILNGNTTEGAIANTLIASPEFTNRYGNLTDSQFVSKMFENGLGRSPDTSELLNWTKLLESKTVSRADLVVGISDSPDYSGVAAKTNAMTAAVDSSSSENDAIQRASLHKMVQAMSSMGEPSSDAWSPNIAGSSNSHAQSLAVAHH